MSINKKTINIENTQKAESINFGLTEEIKKEIFNEILLAERESVELSSQQNILDQLTGTDLNKVTVLSKIRQEIEDKLKKEIMKKYSFTGNELIEINMEGMKKGRSL